MKLLVKKVDATAEASISSRLRFQTATCMSTLSQTERYPDYRAFTRLLCVHVQTFERSLDFCAFTGFCAFLFGLSRVHEQPFVFSFPVLYEFKVSDEFQKQIAYIPETSIIYSFRIHIHKIFI